MLYLYFTYLRAPGDSSILYWKEYLTLFTRRQQQQQQPLQLSNEQENKKELPAAPRNGIEPIEWDNPFLHITSGCIGFGLFTTGNTIQIMYIKHSRK